ncbi:MAG: tRNA (adenosine(37)-N6)-threonylcarbamoyltransferase complex ATPase subunit type 1 TsaE [Rubrivivax sp.]|jgi:tRNA threonylcarbamoyladenosine biosynthesis protein TsaE|nr:tRNA (adenosine(37)-N6)-threonylcarbamoyltransferase complex ATPase subunit type 1 TsaE [Rubrivivax sp.]
MLRAHDAILGTRLWQWPDESACAASAQRLARGLGRLAEPRSLTIELHGTLGAGKTTFVRHLLRALGIAGRVKSPTYTVLEPYASAGLAISHFDFYRLADAREAEDAGFREVFERPGLKLVEWPERVPGLWAGTDLALHIEVEDIAGDAHPAHEPAGEPARAVHVEAFSANGQAVLD